MLFSFCSLNSYANNKYGVLAYHSVVDDTNKNGKNYYYPQTISAQHLIQHFNWLKENGFHVISWQQVLDAENGKTALPDNAVLLSFDDGYETMYSVVYPLLKAYNYSAVFAPVASWINTKGEIQYGNEKLPRSTMTTWEHIKEMRDSGLVEIASHSYNQHFGHKANPAGSSLPAIISPEYKNGKYETKAHYTQRLERDFAQSAQDIKKATGIAPNIMVWPYGQYNDTAIKAAEKAGMSHHFSLKSERLNHIGTRHVGRLLIDAETSFDTLKEYLTGTLYESNLTRAVHIKLDDLYSSDPAQFNRNFDALISRIYHLGVNVVYLQAYADDNHDNIADALYFPNSYLPMKSDLFSRVAWQLFNRTGVKVYAEMPINAINLPNKDKFTALKSIYNDLSFYAKFNGILFNDPTSPTSQEDLSHLVNMSEDLKNAIAPYAMHGSEYLLSAYALNITEQTHLVQSITTLKPHFNQVLLQISPYSQPNTEASKQLSHLLNTLKENKQIALNKVVFDFSTINEQTKQPIATQELINWIKLLEENHIYSFGYSSDNFIQNNPNIKEIKPYISANPDALKK